MHSIASTGVPSADRIGALSDCRTRQPAATRTSSTSSWDQPSASAAWATLGERPWWRTNSSSSLRNLWTCSAVGHTSREIADIPSISVNTVARHRHNVLEKLDLRDRVALTLYAVRRGLVQP